MRQSPNCRTNLRLRKSSWMLSWKMCSSFWTVRFKACRVKWQVPRKRHVHRWSWMQILNVNSGRSRTRMTLCRSRCLRQLRRSKRSGGMSERSRLSSIRHSKSQLRSPNRLKLLRNVSLKRLKLLRARNWSRARRWLSWMVRSKKQRQSRRLWSKA